MTTFDYAAFILIAVGIAARLSTARRFFDLYLDKYGSPPPRTWLIHRVDDPEVERWRRYTAIGPVLVVLGTLTLLLQIFVSGPVR